MHFTLTKEGAVRHIREKYGVQFTPMRIWTAGHSGEVTSLKAGKIRLFSRHGLDRWVESKISGPKQLATV